MTLSAFCLTFLIAVASLDGGPAPLPIGAPAPDFSLRAIDGNTVTLQQLRGSPEQPRVVAVVFWSHRCPWVVKGWDSVLQGIREEYERNDQVRFAIIDSNDKEIADPAAIQRYLQQRGHDHLVLLDPAQHTANAYGGLVTPHCFVINREGRIVYQGRVDNGIEFPGDRRKPAPKTRHLLRDAIQAALRDQSPPIRVDRARGCVIRRTSKPD